MSALLFRELAACVEVKDVKHQSLLVMPLSDLATFIHKKNGLGILHIKVINTNLERELPRCRNLAFWL